MEQRAQDLLMFFRQDEAMLLGPPFFQGHKATPIRLCTAPCLGWAAEQRLVVRHSQEEEENVNGDTRQNPS